MSEFGKVITGYCGADLVCRILIVSVRGFIAAFDHIHPDLPVFDQAELEGLPSGISGAVYFGVSSVFEQILECFPCEFMGEFKRLNESLLLKIRQGTFLCEFKRGAQTCQRLGVI